MSKLDRLTFRVPDAKACQAFYIKMLGMSILKSPTMIMGYTPSGLNICFHEESAPCSMRRSTSHDAYWKIGITVKNLDRAVEFLNRQAVTVSKPTQFLDIGYLCHLQDPAGCSIELLQHGFQGDEQEIVGDDRHPIGGQATLAHVTLRSNKEIFPKIQEWCTETLRMQLLSVQPVKPFNFTLYFYGWPNDEDEPMPQPDDLEAVENRPWLWARPYGILEIQHRNEMGNLRVTGDHEAGPTELQVWNEEKRKHLSIPLDLWAAQQWT